MSTGEEHTIYEAIPYLIARDASSAIDFYARAFGAVEEFRITGNDGVVGHAELRFGPTLVMIADEFPQYGILSPTSIGGNGSRLHLHVENVDELAHRAVSAGATYISEPMDEPHGERQCRLRDPFGHEWLLGHQIEKLSREEMLRRSREMQSS